MIDITFCDLVKSQLPLGGEVFILRGDIRLHFLFYHQVGSKEKIVELRILIKLTFLTYFVLTWTSILNFKTLKIIKLRTLTVCSQRVAGQRIQIHFCSKT